MKNNLQNHVKLEVALELMNSKIANFMIENDDEDDIEKTKSFQNLMEQSERIYSGDREEIEKLLNECTKRGGGYG